jgi:hypothetical protein
METNHLDPSSCARAKALKSTNTTPKIINRKSNFKRIVSYAEGIQEAFLVTSSENIANFGENSIFKTQDDLLEHYYYSFYFTKVSRKINENLILKWSQYAYPRKDDLINDLRQRIEILRKKKVITDM